MSIKVMTWYWDNSDLSGTELLCMLALSDWSNDEGICWPGKKGIAKKCRLAIPSVTKLLGKLVESDQLRVEYGKGKSTEHGKTNRYHLVAYQKATSQIAISRSTGKEKFMPKSQGVSAGIPQGVSAGIPQGVSAGIPQGVSAGIPKPLVLTVSNNYEEYDLSLKNITCGSEEPAATHVPENVLVVEPVVVEPKEQPAPPVALPPQSTPVERQTPRPPRKTKSQSAEQTETPEHQAWFEAIAWCVTGLTKEQLGLMDATLKITIGKTVKEIRNQPITYTLDDLRCWWRDIWTKEWPGLQKDGTVQRPKCTQVKSGIGRVRARNMPTPAIMQGAKSMSIYDHDFTGPER